MASRNPRVILIATVLLALIGAPGPSRAQSRDRAGPTPPRLGFVDGDVSFWRPGADDWTPAQVNTALAEGDEVYAGEGANVELQIGQRAFVRASDGTQLGLETLDSNYTQYKVNGGHAAFDLKQLPRGQRLEIDTPAAAFTIDRPGYYRVDVDDQGTGLVVRRGGVVHVVAASGDQSDVGDNRRLVLASDGSGLLNAETAPDLDAWDRWNYDRTGQFAETPRSAAYVPQGVAGVDDLDRYGDWREEPKYGRVWVPRDVGQDWAPYSTGRWVYDPYYEWTWVDEAPWGWCPYHYGRWVHFGGYWGWAPGPVVAQPVYAPALVAFFGAPGIGVSVSVGAPLVSWVALGFGEPVIPWWGGGGFVGRPYWGGWGGPRIVNNVVVNNTTIVNVRNINHFQNADVRHAIVGIDRGRFGRGGGHLRVEPRRLELVHGHIGVRPTAASLTPREGRGKRPPRQFQDRKLVATRAPRDPIHRLREDGVEAAAAPSSRPAPRIVQPHWGQRRPGAPTLAAGESRHSAEVGPVTPPDRAPRPDAGHGRPGERTTIGRSSPPEPPRLHRPQRDAAPAPARPSRANREAPARVEGPRSPAQARDRSTAFQGRGAPPDRPGRLEPPARKAPPQHRMEPSGPRDAVPTPLPPGERSRFERPQRSASRERQLDAPMGGEVRSRTRDVRQSPQRPPQPERHARPQAGRDRKEKRAHD